MATGKHGLELPAAISASLFVLAGAFAGALAGLLYDLFSIVGSIEVDSNFTVQRACAGALIGAAVAVVVVVVRGRRNRK